MPTQAAADRADDAEARCLGTSPSFQLSTGGQFPPVALNGVLVHTHRKILYWLAFSDGLALLALVFVAVPVKYVLDLPIGVRLLGPLHGALFLSLAATTLSALGRGILRPGLAALLLGGALLPLGAFFADHQLRQAYPELRH